jgi:hypothetical protein
MKKKDIFFIISNYNTDPECYLSYCSDYLIYDQSTEEPVKLLLREKYQKIQFVENTGHNLSDYFRFFHENWGSLPETMILAKGNMIGRHLSQAFFDRVVNNRVFTHLYEDRTYKEKPGVSSQLFDGHFLEINTSWYMKTKPHRYFETFNSMLRFIFKDPLIPAWLVFSPGACYIVPREHVQHYPASFWLNLKNLVSYTYFPAEAYVIERMLPIIFSNTYELNPWMIDSELFNAELEKLRLGKHPCTQSRFAPGHRLRTLLQRIATVLRTFGREIR